MAPVSDGAYAVNPKLEDQELKQNKNKTRPAVLKSLDCS